MIISTVWPRSYLSPFLIALEVYLYRKYDSRMMINMLHTLHLDSLWLSSVWLIYGRAITSLTWNTLCFSVTMWLKPPQWGMDWILRATDKRNSKSICKSCHHCRLHLDLVEFIFPSLENLETGLWRFIVYLDRHITIAVHIVCWLGMLESQDIEDIRWGCITVWCSTI